MAKNKFIQIMLQMFLTDPTLMRSQQPSLQKCDNPVYMGQRVLRGTVDSTNNPLESPPLQLAVDILDTGGF